VKPKPIRVLIADDHEIVREGLRNLFRGEPDIEVVAEARDGAEALRAAQEHRPDVALMDLVMPETDGLEATRRMREVSPETRVLVLTSFAEDRQVHEALRCGAAGYLLKDVSRRVAPDPARSMLEDLTAREREVLELMAKGRGNRAIAEALFLSEGTVKGYVSIIFGKLGVQDRTQAALWAVKHGIVTREQL